MGAMRQFLFRLLIIGVLVCFGIFYGVDLATQRMTELNGHPFQSESAVDGVGADFADSVASETGDHASKRREDIIAVIEHESALPKQVTPVQDRSLVTVLADTAGHVLQRTARGGIELIVSLFDGILH